VNLAGRTGRKSRYGFSGTNVVASLHTVNAMDSINTIAHQHDSDMPKAPTPVATPAEPALQYPELLRLLDVLHATSSVTHATLARAESHRARSAGRPVTPGPGPQAV
jgi:hypothetical protein